MNLFLKHESSNKEEQNRHSEIKETSRIGGCSIINRFDFYQKEKKRKNGMTSYASSSSLAAYMGSLHPLVLDGSLIQGLKDS